MKKIITILLLATALTACTSNKIEPPTDNQTEGKQIINTRETKDFVVEEIKDDSVLLSSVTEGEEDIKYMTSLKDLKLNDLKVGEQIRIEWDGVTLTSDPAQFGKIIKAEKLLQGQ